MAIVFLQTPPGIAAAFNEIPLVVQTPKARYDQLTQDLKAATTEAQRAKIQKELDSLQEVRNQTTIDPITFVAHIGNDPAMKRTVTITPEQGPDGKSHIDLSYIMRRAFVDTPNSYHYDGNILANGYIDDNGTSKANFYAVNAVGQLGYYDSSKGFDGYAKLTSTPLTRYKGYPFYITLRAPKYETLDCFAYYNGSSVWSGIVHYPLGNIFISANEPNINKIDVWTLGEDSEFITSYPVAEGCVPDAPFYVRWINTSGGWDSWMFERREETDDVEDVNNIQLYIADPTDTQQTVSLNAARTVTVGEGLLSKDDYRTLAALPRSPRIQWYNEELQRWQTIVIAEGFSASWNSRNGFGSVEFTFALPRILTQF